MDEKNREDKLMVSVVVTTYNHEAYIKQALEGILAQEVSFSYEIIVGDDYSTDGTNEIVRRFVEKYPSVMRLVRNEKNIGEQKNTCRLLRLCKGKYIAVCEGDDYWTEKTKLERQISFLEQNPSYIGTAHNVLCVDKKGRKLSKRLTDFPYQKQHIYGKANALKYEELGQMSSYVYRNIWKSMPLSEFRLFATCKANTDIKLNATLGMMGDVYYFEEVWSCRRKLFEGDGWTAYAFNNNHRDYSYKSCLNIKNYVKVRFNETMEVDYFLFKMWYDAIKQYLQNPTDTNLKVVRKINALRGENKFQEICDITRIWVLEKIWGERAFIYEHVYQNIARYGYYAPVEYWVSEKEKCMYVQNPKVACSSIKAAMYHLPKSIEDYEKIHDCLRVKGKKINRIEGLERRYQDYYKFTFVRNPYARLVSCYVNKYITDKQNKKPNYFREYFISKFADINSFHEFIWNIFLIPDLFADGHFRSQNCITKAVRRNSKINYIGRYENLQKEFENIAQNYDFAELEWYNKSFEYDWRDFYTLSTAIAVYIRYHRDFKELGYQREIVRLIKYILKKSLRGVRGK